VHRDGIARFAGAGRRHPAAISKSQDSDQRLDGARTGPHGKTAPRCATGEDGRGHWRRSNCGAPISGEPVDVAVESEPELATIAAPEKVNNTTCHYYFRPALSCAAIAV
jgi:hypothetical protein